VFATEQVAIAAGCIIVVALIIVLGLRKRWDGAIGAKECAYVATHAEMLGRIDANVAALRKEVASQNRKAVFSLAASEALVHVGKAAIKYMTKRQLNGEVEDAEVALASAESLIREARAYELEEA
jgi:hypothetical protein